jgi:hypothetical protein
MTSPKVESVASMKSGSAEVLVKTIVTGVGSAAPVLLLQLQPGSADAASRSGRVERITVGAAE